MKAKEESDPRRSLGDRVRNDLYRSQVFWVLLLPNTWKTHFLDDDPWETVILME
jgi:hypothetical protein